MTQIEQKIRQALLKDINNWVDESLFGTHPKFLHVVIVGDDEQMLLVAKQMALLAHFPTFDENKQPITCTKISILGLEKTSDFWKDVFGNLLKWQDSWITVPLDIVIEHVALVKDVSELESCAETWIQDHKCESTKLVVYNAEYIDSLIELDKKTFSDEARIDMAMRANMVYDASQKFDIIRSNDLDNIKEYEKPVKMFVSISNKEVLSHWNNITEEVLKTSNFCLVDSLLVRMRSLDMMKKNRHLCFLYRDTMYKTLSENLFAMSMSEHARWNVEKLINGFRPFTKEEKSKHNGLSDVARKEYEMSLKKDPNMHAHIDLCSYERLRSIDPNSVKYDSFLLLAMIRYCGKKNLYGRN